MIFTSGATEARNLGRDAACSVANRARGRHAVATGRRAPGHPRRLPQRRARGGALDLVGVDGEGRVDPAALAAAAARRHRARLRGARAARHRHAPGRPRVRGRRCGAARPEARVWSTPARPRGWCRSTPAAWEADAIVLGGGSIGGPRWTGALAVRPGRAPASPDRGGLAGGRQARGRRGPAGHRRASARRPPGEGGMRRRARGCGARPDRLTEGLLAVPTCG